MKSLTSKLDEIVENRRKTLHERIEQRKREMAQNRGEQLVLYQVLGFDVEEGQKIDLYQNIGRFLYRYAGALLEDLTETIFEELKNAKSISIPNSVSSSPQMFEIDSYVEEDNKAHEIKWRNATTDGDHVRRDFDKTRCVSSADMIPVRVMFYMPDRKQALRIQERVKESYQRDGEAYIEEDAWDYVKRYTGFDLKSYLFDKIS